VSEKPLSVRGKSPDRLECLSHHRRKLLMQFGGTGGFACRSGILDFCHALLC